jgi:hypothetical protein
LSAAFEIHLNYEYFSKSHNKGLSQCLQSQIILLYFQSNNVIGTVQIPFPSVKESNRVYGHYVVTTLITTMFLM